MILDCVLMKVMKKRSTNAISLLLLLAKLKSWLEKIKILNNRDMAFVDLRTSLSTHKVVSPLSMTIVMVNLF